MRESFGEASQITNQKKCGNLINWHVYTLWMTHLVGRYQFTVYKYSTYCVMGPIRINQLRLVVTIPIIYKAFSTIQPLVGLGISEPSTAIEIQGASPPETPLECWNERQLGCDVPEGKTKTQRGHVETHQMFPNLPVVGLTYIPGTIQTWVSHSNPHKSLVLEGFFLGGWILVFFRPHPAEGGGYEPQPQPTKRTVEFQPNGISNSGNSNMCFQPMLRKVTQSHSACEQFDLAAWPQDVWKNKFIPSLWWLHPVG